MDLLPSGTYRYEIRRRTGPDGTEKAFVAAGKITASFQEIAGRITHQVEATIDDSGTVIRLELRYASSLFKRDAGYCADGDTFRGTVSAMAGRNEVVIKRGRFGEVEVAEMAIFRALIIARVKARGQTRWTGRVVVIEANSLMAASIKQSCRFDATTGLWIYEKRMGDVEELEFDHDGKLVRRRDSSGREDVLLTFDPQ